MKILDLFCGGGGASLGLSKYGDIVGVDIQNQKEYQWEFIEHDALTLDLEFYKKFDFIWASPPCQAYCSICAQYRNNGKKYPELLDDTRKLLMEVDKPFVIENVPGSPIRRGLLLCGGMFDLGVIRHRYFEIYGFIAKPLEHKEHRDSVITVIGDGYDLNTAQKSMDIYHINNKKTLSQAIPPRYSDYIIQQFLIYGKDNNQITYYENTKTHRLIFMRNGKEIYETSKIKGLEIVNFISNNIPGIIYQELSQFDLRKNLR